MTLSFRYFFISVDIMQSIESILLVSEIILYKLPYQLKLKIMKEFLSPPKDASECVLCTRKFCDVTDYPFFKILSIKFPKSFTRVRISDPDYDESKHYLKDEAFSKVKRKLEKLKINKPYSRDFFRKIFGEKFEIDEGYDFYTCYQKLIADENERWFNNLNSEFSFKDGKFIFKVSFKFYLSRIFKESIKIVIQGIVS